MKKQIWLGAYSPGGLSLPNASPTPSQFYAPRGVFFNDDWLVVADSGNHRILLWRGGLPVSDGAPADVVLGQPDFFHEGPKLLHLPTGVLIHEGRFLVADAWHHRVLVWNRVPETSGVEPDYAIGQDHLRDVEPNRGGRVDANTLYWPYGLGVTGDWFWIADTGNRRVLGWCGIPRRNEPAQVILGQPNEESSEENRGGPVSARSFRWPHAIAGSASRLWVADAGNHRVLGFAPLPTVDTDAAIVLGQPGFTSAAEMPHVAQGPAKMRFPYSVASSGGTLAVADTANNRVLLFEEGASTASRVLGQIDFNGGGENRWKAVEHDTLCWPYGIWMHRGRLAVADSGNNRVMLWTIKELEGESNLCASQFPDESKESTMKPALEWAR